MNIFVFDIETIPDTDAGRRLYHLEELNDADVVQAIKIHSKGKTATSYDTVFQLPTQPDIARKLNVPFDSKKLKSMLASLKKRKIVGAKVFKDDFKGLERFWVTLRGMKI